MMLLLLIAIPLAGGILSWILNRRIPNLSPWISLGALSADLALVAALWVGRPADVALTGQGPWLTEFRLQWIPQWGVTFHLAMDGLSLILVALTILLGLVATVSSWTEIRERIGFFHFNMMWTLAGIIGVFLAVDLFLFYFFWELMLVPMFFLICFWGHENRTHAALKFFIFTQVSGLIMLLSILGLFFVHGSATGNYTFDYLQLIGTPMAASASTALMLGFLIAFAVKLPVVPLHTWLPDAHTEAPTAGSIILAGLLLKTGAYGLLRFVVPLFPEAAVRFTPVAMILAVVGILYGAVMAFAQIDLKRLVAYTSVSHMGFVLLGVFAWNAQSLQGAVMQMVCHGISTGALFFLAGALQERTQTRDMTRMGGLWSAVPRMGAVGLLFALASLGLPGLGNFVAEVLVLVGSFRDHPVITVIATIGFIAASVYSLWMIQSTFFGKNTGKCEIPDFSIRDMSAMASMIVIIVWLGIYPQPLLDTAGRSLEFLREIAAAGHAQVNAGDDTSFSIARAQPEAPKGDTQ
ncbi:MAG TPA: NADH-quinone oxidoreductase subunit M [Dissulfurispiraceae bacterium]|nr:NADH-quinone oxidoreductase subunit M [Dissulfurispiraceae bacterium]